MVEGRLKYTRSSRPERRCCTCNNPPHSSTEEADTGGTGHLLVCPTCSVALGTWPGVVAQENEFEALRATR